MTTTPAPVAAAPTVCHICGQPYDYTGLGNARYKCGMLYHLNSGKWLAGCRNVYTLAADLRAREGRAVELLRDLEAHHVKLNDAAGRPQKRSRTLRLVRAALAALEPAPRPLPGDVNEPDGGVGAAGATGIEAPHTA